MPQPDSPVRKTNLKALDRVVRNALRTKHYALRTEKAYVQWILRFVAFHHDRRPSDMGAPEIRQFLTYLATERRVTASTQNQALGAVVFLYRHVLKKDVGDFSDFPRARRPKRLPVVLSRPTAVAEVRHHAVARLRPKHAPGRPPPEATRRFMWRKQPERGAGITT